MDQNPKMADMSVLIGSQIAGKRGMLNANTVQPTT